MPTYIMLARWTSQGVKNVRDSPSRVEATRKAFQAVGGSVKDLYLVTGRYDFVLVVEAPDDIALAKATLAIASKGNLHTETLRAFTEDEYRKIIGGL